jgi:hypothetical protein
MVGYVQWVCKELGGGGLGLFKMMPGHSLGDTPEYSAAHPKFKLGLFRMKGIRVTSAIFLNSLS